MKHLITIITTTIIFILILPSAAKSQLAIDWSLDLSRLQPESSIGSHCVKIDGEGNVYIAYKDFGIGVIKIRPDKSIAFQTVYPSTERPYVLLVGPSGECYVLAGEEINMNYDHFRVFRFEPSGTASWSYSWGNPSASFINTWGMDFSGNLWIATADFVYDAPCLDSTLETVLMKGTSAGMSVVNRFRGTRLNGGTYPNTLNPIVTGALGDVSLLVYEGAKCYNEECDEYPPECYVDNYGNPTLYWSQLDLRKYSGGGGYINQEVLYTSDNPSDDPTAEYSIYQSRNGGPITVSTYQPNPAVYTYESTVAYGSWEITIPNEIRYVCCDYNNDIYLTSTVTVENQPSTYTLYKLNGASGAVLWTLPDWYDVLAVDLENNIYCRHYGKLDPDGKVLWNWPYLGSAGSVGTLVGIDNQNNHYHFDGVLGQKVLYKLVEKLTPVFEDANGDPLANKEFEIVRLDNDPPYYTEHPLGTIMTDNDGKFEFKVAIDSDWEAIIGGETVSFNTGDLIKFTRHLQSQPSSRHPVSLSTSFSVHVDNAQFNDDGSVSFYELGQDEATIRLDHQEIRYNLLVSLEWDSETAFQTGLQADFRNMSNYLYDVTDGLIRLDTIRILDNKEVWDWADVQIRATNMHRPDAVPGAINHFGWYPINMPRKWYGGQTANREGTVNDYPHDTATDANFRTMAHEFGHHALGFRDEYKFIDGSGNDLGAGARCVARPAGNHGCMDYQYQDGTGGVMASEMSTRYRYTDPNCRKTAQYVTNGSSCWDMVERMFQGIVNGVYLPVKKPDQTDDVERLTPPGLDYFPGPNDNLRALNYDVGAKIVFTELISSPDPTVGAYLVLVDDVPSGGVNVTLNVDNGSGAVSRVIDQGNTTDLGLIYVLGANQLYDDILASGKRWNYTQPPGLSLSSPVIEQTWLTGHAKISGDTTVMHLIPVEGDYPLIFAGTVGTVGFDIAVTFNQSFSAVPDLNVFADDNVVYSYSMEMNGSGYAADITDSTGNAGTVRLSAVDNGGNPFSVDVNFTVFSDSAGNYTKVIGPLSGVVAGLDTANTSLESVMFLSSLYPVIRNGLAPDAVQAGPSHSLSVYPAIDLSGVNTLTIAYSDVDLVVDSSHVADESQLQMYRWNPSLVQWQVIGGLVDTVENTVTSSVTTTGVYAAFTTQIITDVEDDGYGNELPYEFELSQNYPNPFNPVTTVDYTLPRRSHISIEIYNILGQKVRTLVDREEPAGSYSVSWDGSTASGQPAATGVYLYRFQAGDYMETKKMLLLK